MKKYILFVSFYSSPTQFDMGRALTDFSSYNLEELKQIADTASFVDNQDYIIIQDMFLDLQKSRGINSGSIYLEATIHEITPEGKVLMDNKYGTFAYEFTPNNW